MNLYLDGFLLICSFFTLWMARPERMSRLGRNAWIGIRTPDTTSSDEAWEVAHREAWPSMRRAALFLGALCIGAIIIDLFNPEWGDDLGAVFIVSGVLIYLSFIVHAHLLFKIAVKKLNKVNNFTHRS